MVAIKKLTLQVVLWIIQTHINTSYFYEYTNLNLRKEYSVMKNIMFGNSLMLLGIALIILTALELMYVGVFWISFILIIIGFTMATVGFFSKDS